MLADLVELIPLALGIAVSPAPVAGVLVLLLSPAGRPAATGFTAGWVCGIAFVTMAAGFASTLVILPSLEERVEHPLFAWIIIGLGVALFAAGAVQLARRARADESVTPRWVANVGRLSSRQSLLVGFAYAAFRPKNFVLAFAAGATIGRADIGPIATALTAAVFAAAASITVVSPVVYFAGRQRDGGHSDRLRQWMLRHISTIGSGALVLLGGALVAIGLWRLL